MPPRKSYTADFKLEAVAYAKENGNRATGHDQTFAAIRNQRCNFFSEAFLN
jgi:transposase-like protein